MAVVQKTVLLAFSAEQMFALVEKVEDYPAFLPWCGGVEVKQRSPEKLVATISIAYHGIKQSFTTENQNTAPRHMQMKLVEGPFSSWTDNGISSHCAKMPAKWSLNCIMNSLAKF
jgi:ribosome-associated toxin RatA of RatAB toxin-antitoxin module